MFQRSHSNHFIIQHNPTYANEVDEQFFRQKEVKAVRLGDDVVVSDQQLSPCACFMFCSHPCSYCFFLCSFLPFSSIFLLSFFSSFISSYSLSLSPHFPHPSRTRFIFFPSRLSPLSSLSLPLSLLPFLPLFSLHPLQVVKGLRGVDNSGATVPEKGSKKHYKGNTRVKKRIISKMQAL